MIWFVPSSDKGANRLDSLPLPQPFTNRMRRLLGDEYEAFAATYGEPRTHGLRVNRLKTDPAALAARLGMPVDPVPWTADGLYFPASLRPGRHPLHAAGLYYMQEPSAMAVAPLLAPRPGERVLDLAAAPGGKTTHLAALMENRGLLVANEVHPARARSLLENVERMGITCAVVLNERPDRLARSLPGFFDRILVDAPCSGEGMFRKLPEARESWRPDLPSSCARVQGQILDDAVAMLRPGGLLVYSTCTFAPEENEEVLLQLLTRHPELRLLDLPAVPGIAPARPDWTSDPDRAAALGVHRAGRLWPHRLRGEGHFVALLRKLDEAGSPGEAGPWGTPESAGRAPAESAGRTPAESAGRTPTGKGRIRAGRATQEAQGWAPARREALGAFAAFCREALSPEGADALQSGEIAQHGDWLYRPPEGSEALAGLHVLRAGLQLGLARKGRFEPAHALALALRPERVRQTCDLSADSPAAMAYLRGETLPARGQKGWTLVTVDGFPLGWARASDGVLKNHYPKGLRWLSSPPPAGDGED
uniref:RsmB/NOP family class I SAM-dependent RNA methyltransferase n=1 Tax=Symbiobacterium terraclitae TaxID=557451 RepID=UPI0035B54A76